MKNKAFLLSTKIVVMVLALSGVLLAEGPRSTTSRERSTTTTPSPWEGTRFAERGRSGHPNFDAVDFRAALNMEHPDLWMISNKQPHDPA